MNSTVGPLLSGATGELADRLIMILNAPEGSDWRELSWHVVFAIGGPLFGVEPERDAPPTPGSIGELHSQTLETVSRARYFQLIRKQIVHLVCEGLREDVLVRGIRDEVTRFLDAVVGDTEAETRREAHRKYIVRALEDVPEHRRRLEQSGMDDPEMTDLQVREILKTMLTRLETPTIEQELERVRLHGGWLERRDALLSDEVLKTWLDKRASATFG